jgi:hypothetical protein
MDNRVTRVYKAIREIQVFSEPVVTVVSPDFRVFLAGRALPAELVFRVFLDGQVDMDTQAKPDT